jgi:hypothetical protein
LRAIESVLGPVLGYSEEILSKRLFVRDTEGSTPYTTYLAYSTGMAGQCGSRPFGPLTVTALLPMDWPSGGHEVRLWTRGANGMIRLILLLGIGETAEVATRTARFVSSKSEAAAFFVQAFRLLVPVISIPINQELLRREVVWPAPPPPSLFPLIFPLPLSQRGKKSTGTA